MLRRILDYTPFSLIALIFLLIAALKNYGFYTPQNFILLTISLIFMTVWVFRPQHKKIPDIRPAMLGFFFLLCLGGAFYGGMYQDMNTRQIGMGVFFITLMACGIFYAFKKRTYLPVIIGLYVFLALVTIYTSPYPHVDTIVVLTEAPLKFLHGINPYNTLYSSVYSSVTPNYYNYLPVSFIYMLPFVLIFSDPRFGVVAANLISALVIYLLFKKHEQQNIRNILIAVFLFLPGSFFMLEHVYLDSVIFTFFSVFIYFSLQRHDKLKALFFSLFLSFRITLFFLFPPYILENGERKKFFTLQSLIYFMAPFSLVIFFFLVNPTAFLDNIVFGLSPSRITSPIADSLTLPTFLNSGVIPLPFSSGTVYTLCFVLFLLIYAGLLFLKKIPYVTKTALLVFVFNYCAYHAFFNSYYLAAELMVFDVALTLAGPWHTETQLPSSS